MSPGGTLPFGIRTERLVLDQPLPGDVDDIARYCVDPLFEEYLSIPWPYRREHAVGFVAEFVPKGWLRGEEWTWAIRESAGGPLLGVIGCGCRAAWSDSGWAPRTAGAASFPRPFPP